VASGRRKFPMFWRTGRVRGWRRLKQLGLGRAWVLGRAGWAGKRWDGLERVAAGWLFREAGRGGRACVWEGDIAKALEVDTWNPGGCGQVTLLLGLSVCIAGVIVHPS
jgi:hypothetical protein